MERFDLQWRNSTKKDLAPQSCQSAAGRAIFRAMSITVIVKNDIIRLPVGLHLPDGTVVRLGIAHAGEPATRWPAGGRAVNGSESFWSYAKFRFRKLRGVRKDRFLLHLKECARRFNHRRAKLHPLPLSLLRQNPL